MTPPEVARTGSAPRAGLQAAAAVTADVDGGRSRIRWTHAWPVVLRPTVDSAGPQLTTWQSSDTLRLFVPWKQAIGPRWLIVTLEYQTLSHSGQRSRCGGRLGTDTLRFRPT